MGAGAFPEQTEAQLVHEAFQLNLGFSESQISSAIKHLVKEYGSVKDAPAWIRQDNFTVLVNYILDYTDKEISRPMSGATQGQTQHFKVSENKEKMTGGKPSLLSKKVAHGSMSGRTFSPKAVGSNVDHQEDSLIHEKRTVEKQQSHSHCTDKPVTNFDKDSRGSLDLKSGELKNKTTETVVATRQIPGGQGSANKTARPSLNQMQHLAPIMPTVNQVQILHSQSVREEKLSKKKREKEMNELMSSPQKKGKAYEPEAMKDLHWEARTLLQSGCQDLATGSDDHQDVRSSDAKLMGLESLKYRHLSGKSQARNEMFELECATKEWTESREQSNGGLVSAENPCFLVNRDRREDACSNSTRVNSNVTNSSTLVDETCRTEVLSLGAEQKIFNASNTHGMDDFEPECPFLKMLEASLKQGNCESALEVLKAWKLERKQGGTRQIKDIFSQGEGYEMIPKVPGRKKGFVVSYDISRGLERLPISCVNEYSTEVLPENFLYVTKSVIRQAAHVDMSLSRIGDLHCCCSDDCLRSSEACKCTDSTRGEYAYDKNGRLIERLAIGFVSGCTTINGDFITECCDKCRCNMRCGNRIVQHGITRRLQVFMTRRKGWGVRALEKIPARSFVFEYLGEIATNSEQYDRNLEYKENGVYTYVMCLDAS